MIKPLERQDRQDHRDARFLPFRRGCAGRRIALAGHGKFRSKFSPEALESAMPVPVNLGSFATFARRRFHTTDHNLVILAAARNNEVAWDTSKGGAMTYNFEQCLDGRRHRYRSQRFDFGCRNGRLRPGEIGQVPG